MSAYLKISPGNPYRLAFLLSGKNLDGTSHDGSGATLNGTLTTLSGDEVWTGDLEEIGTVNEQTTYAAAVLLDASDVPTPPRLWLRVTGTRGELPYSNREPVIVIPERSDAA